MSITHCVILISKFYVMPYFVYLFYVALKQSSLKLTNFTYNHFYYISWFYEKNKISQHPIELKNHQTFQLYRVLTGIIHSI